MDKGDLDRYLTTAPEGFECPVCECVNGVRDKDCYKRDEFCCHDPKDFPPQTQGDELAELSRDLHELLERLDKIRGKA